MELDLAGVAVEPLLEHALAMVRERAARQGVSLELEVEPASGWCSPTSSSSSRSCSTC